MSNHEFLRDLGVDELIDYHDVDFAEEVRDIDIVLDTIGGDYQLRSLQTLRPGGRMVATVPFRNGDWRTRLRGSTCGLS